MNHTTNYQLNQWDPDDKVQRTDFNADNAKIDAALGALTSGKADASALNALQTVVNGKGNCKIEIGSYEGDGDYNRTMSISASFKPKLFIVVGEFTVFMFQGEPTVTLTVNTSSSRISLTWSGNSVSWKVEGNPISRYLNELGTHHYIALG